MSHVSLKKIKRKARDRRSKSPLMWPIITGENRKQYEKQFAEEWIKKNENAGNPDKLDEAEIEKISKIVGKYEVKKIQKGTKVYWKRGGTHFSFMGDSYPIENQAMMEERINFMAEQQKLKKAQSEEE